jgi:hypothetical protein
MDHRTRLVDCTKEELIDLLEDAAKNWLAHDGLWFLAAEEAFGIETAIELDTHAWERFTVLEARRIMKRHSIAPGGGLEALETALGYRLYAYINVQEAVWENEKSLVFKMKDCRVQSARQRKGLPDFPCKPVGLIEYGNFARTIDPRIRTDCLSCPPDPHPADYWCSWRFSLEEAEE